MTKIISQAIQLTDVASLREALISLSDDMEITPVEIDGLPVRLDLEEHQIDGVYTYKIVISADRSRQ